MPTQVDAFLHEDYGQSLSLGAWNGAVENTAYISIARGFANDGSDDHYLLTVANPVRERDLYSITPTWAQVTAISVTAIDAYARKLTFPNRQRQQFRVLNEDWEPLAGVQVVAFNRQNPNIFLATKVSDLAGYVEFAHETDVDFNGTIGYRVRVTRSSGGVRPDAAGMVRLEPVSQSSGDLIVDIVRSVGSGDATLETNVDITDVTSPVTIADISLADLDEGQRQGEWLISATLKIDYEFTVFGED